MNPADLDVAVQETLKGLFDSSQTQIISSITDMLRSGTHQHALSNHLAAIDNPHLQLHDDRTRYDRAAVDLLVAYYRAQLPPSLEQLLQGELDAGNTVREVSIGWPKDSSVFMKFNRPVTATIPDWLEFREVNDPHWWKAEIYDPRTGHLFAW